MTEITDRYEDIDIVERLEQMADELMEDGAAGMASDIMEAVGTINYLRNK